MMADDVAVAQSIEKGPSTSESTMDDQRPKSINVNVDISGDRWVVVSYQDEKGDLFHGMLLKDWNSTESPASQESVKDGSHMSDGGELWKKSTRGRESLSWLSTAGFPQSMFFNGLSRSPEWDPNKISAVALRRTLSNGTAKKDDDFGLANSKPALGIRRLENRSVRLRPTASQRSTVLCAKCQEQRIWLPPSRRTVTNGSMDRITRNGAVSLVSSNSGLHGSSISTSSKRRFSDAVDPPTSSPSTTSQSGMKKFKTRNLTSMAAEADHTTSAALPAASKVIPTSDGEGLSKIGQSECAATTTEKKVLLKIPKLKISFGNNEEKTTTIIPLPPTLDNGEEDFGKACNGSGSIGGSTEKDGSIARVSCANGDTFDDREGAQLPGGELRVGDVVWAKMPGSPYWPAKIFSASGNSSCVTWCGSRQYGFVEFKAMEPFKDAFRKRYNAKRTTGGYQKAVGEAIVKCSGGDSDASSEDSYYYRHLISAVCWKYLTGSRNAAAVQQARSADRNRRRNSGRNNSGASGRRGKTSKSSKHSFHAVDGIDSESVTSVSSLNSPTSNSTTPNNLDWQPRVTIRAIDREVAEKRRRKMKMPMSWKNMMEEDSDVKPKMDHGRHKLAENEQFYMENRAVSPLPVQRSENDDEDDDDDDDFKKLEIDETAQLDDDDDEDDNADGDQCSSFMNTSESATTYRLVSASPANEKGNGQVSGVRTGRVGEGQDDFESAMTELQEMNELCAGTSVLAQC